MFPQRANVGFARMTGERAIELHVWERGAGWTQACGTGACAAAVAAVETNRAPRGLPIEVVLPGGPLEIVVGAPGERDPDDRPRATRVLGEVRAVKIAVLGTGVVGTTLGTKLVSLGHEVRMGSRVADQREGPGVGARRGRASAATARYGDAASFGADLVINATTGTASLEALRSAGEPRLRGKVLLDVANPLDFSQGHAPDADGRRTPTRSASRSSARSPRPAW